LVWMGERVFLKKVVQPGSERDVRLFSLRQAPYKN